MKIIRNLISCGTLSAALATQTLFASTAPYPAEILAQEARLTNNVSSTYDGFGQSVDISGDRVAVAGDGVTLFNRQADGSWLRDLTLHAGYLSEFAGQVALDGDTLAASGYDYGELTYGPRILVFKRSPDPGLNAWNTSDNSTGAGAYYRYNYPLTANQQTLAEAEGWTLTFRARVNDYGSTPSCFVDITDANEQRFLVFLGVDFQGDLYLVQPNNLGTVTLTSDGLGWSKYHTHEIVYDPANGTADYYFDGQKVNTAPWPKIAGTGLDGVRFGNGSSSGMGSMNVNKIEVTTQQSNQVLALYDAGTTADTNVDLDPEHQGWTRVPDATDSNVSAGPVVADVTTLWPVQTMITPTADVSSLALEGDTLVVGMATAYIGGANRGAAAVYVRNGESWPLQQQLEPSVIAPGDSYGQDVGISGDSVIVGAPRTSSVGRAFVFVRNGTSWTEQKLLTADDGANQDAFGFGVAIDGDRAVVGAKWDDHGTGALLYAGSVYVFERSGSTWTQAAKVFPDSFGSGEQDFGSSVALAGNTLVVGGYYGGTHWVFTTTGSGWKEAQSKVYPDTVDPALHDVAIDGQRFVVGVAGTESESGAAYVFGLDYSNAAGVAEYARKILYFGDAGNATIPFDPNQTAFRYKALLYGDENGDIRPQVEKMAELYGQPERDLAAAAESELLKGLSFHPDDPALGNLLLDINYDRTVADTIVAQDLEERAEKTRIGPPLVAPPPTGGFLIDQEIPLRRQYLAANREATKHYFDLLRMPLDVQTAGSTTTDNDFGHHLFQTLVPGRALMAATYTNSSGAEVPVTANATLFNGYKDLVLLFEQLRDYGQEAETLARLLIDRNGSGDRDEAVALVSDSQRSLLLEGSLLKGMFNTLPPENDPSGIVQAINGWSDAVNGLATVQQLLASADNPLGFADDFMMYVQKFTGTTEYFDSYDALRERLDPTIGSNPLRTAEDALQQAVTSYADYRGFQDQLASQFDNSSITYRDRLRDIVGVYPDDPNYTDDPTANPGSELDQQYNSIELAKLQIQRNQQEITNLYQQIEIEINKATSISNVMVNFGNKQAHLTKVIGHWKAAQASANAVAQSLSVEKLTTGLFIGFLANAAVQGTAEEVIAHKEAKKEELAALEQATITGLETDATVKTLTLSLATLAVDSDTATLTLHQEVNRLVALYREKKQLEQKIAAQNANIAARYFADPVHRLVEQSDMVNANLTFEEAQKWLYFMARALEYKWNTPFKNFNYAGRSWSASSVFKLRNADELVAFYQAMDNYESQIQLPKDDYFDWFSVRDDFMGYKLTNSVGQAIYYADPITGASVDGLTAFRDRLRQLQDAQGNIVLNFSTVTEIPGGTFFRGPRFNAQGQVLSKGLFLDKIRWLKISLPGSHSLNRSQLTGELKYGGTSFIRNFDVGTYNPQRADQLQNEFTSYSTRYWFYHAPSTTWRFNEALSSPVTMQLSSDPRVPPSVQELDVFKERSVATTGWQLTIPTKDAGQTVMNINELNDVELYFYHYAVTRQ
ncbi:hypothetical protein GC207_01830 [bacterium]|nr:hypothetical protein [bacterium]